MAAVDNGLIGLSENGVERFLAASRDTGRPDCHIENYYLFHSFHRVCIHVRFEDQWSISIVQRYQLQVGSMLLDNYFLQQIDTGREMLRKPLTFRIFFPNVANKCLATFFCSLNTYLLVHNKVPVLLLFHSASKKWDVSLLGWSLINGKYVCL